MFPKDVKVNAAERILYSHVTKRHNEKGILMIFGHGDHVHMRVCTLLIGIHEAGFDHTGVQILVSIGAGLYFWN